DLRAARAGIMSPAVGTWILPRRIPDIASLGIDDVFLLHPRLAAESVGQGRGFGRSRFIFTVLEDGREVASRIHGRGRAGARRSASSSPAARRSPGWGGAAARR